MDTNTNRVYINPNFNRVPGRTIYTSESDLTYSNNHMYVNPNFGRNITDGHQFTNVNRKIYVNPNFMRTTNVLQPKEFSENALEINYNIKCLEYSNCVNSHNLNPTPCKTVKPKISENISVRPSLKSRYRLVRRNDHKILESQRQVKESCTIKINKYKSIPIHNFKQNLQVVKNDNTQQISRKSNTSNLSPHYNNCFKFVRHNLKPTVNTSPALIPKSNHLKIKRNLDMKMQLKLKVSNGVRKINNIPCRLYTKYGKCLRNLYGTCEYLHDKKHVSLCRKFIKGICHDKQCLLSHELSSKKMPTCFFYLKGMCTKDDCQYLHVKLNEKSKICHDFLKGYCDKGDMCLHKHVLLKTVKSSDKKRYTLNKHISNKSVIKLNPSKSMKTNQFRLPECKNRTKLENRQKEQIVIDDDGRYFKDLQSKEAMCEVLKPTRCKLGTLPSFISL